MQLEGARVVGHLCLVPAINVTNLRDFYFRESGKIGEKWGKGAKLPPPKPLAAAQVAAQWFWEPATSASA
jgi:hypothetical protein